MRRTITAVFFLLAIAPLSAQETGNLPEVHPRILCTTFPIYQITRQVVQDREGARVELMLPASLGCPHHYALTPQDMQKLADAQILVINGLGMEEFLGLPLQTTNPKLTMIDSSSGITDLLEYADEHDGEAEHHEEKEHHHHDGVNPHLFASPRMAAQLALTIATGLSKADPKGSVLYLENAQAYAATMNVLAGKMAALGKTLKNNRIVQPHGIFDYLARDMGLEVVAAMQPHGQEPSAAEMKELVEHIRKHKAGAIFTEPQYPSGIGQALARETGVPVAELDPVATGPEDAPLDYYSTVMKRNMETLRAVLGVKE
ncbi:MAG: metal ABC transporter substrate-binding protein [Lentisphaerota bacterium]